MGPALPAAAEDDLGLPVSFALTLRGYDRGQVDEHLDQLNAERQLLTHDRDAAVAEAEALTRRLEQMHADNAALRSRIDALCQAPASPEAVSDRVQHLLALARAEADDIVTTAKHIASGLIRDAEQQAAARTEARLTCAQNHPTRLITDARAEAENLVAHARQQTEGLAEARERTAAQLRALDGVLAQADAILDSEAESTSVAGVAAYDVAA
jgi:DivIVA domain-containing protein